MELDRRRNERREGHTGPLEGKERRQAARRLLDQRAWSRAVTEAHVKRLLDELDQLKGELERARFRLAEATRAIRKFRQVGRHK